MKIVSIDVRYVPYSQHANVYHIGISIFDDWKIVDQKIYKLNPDFDFEKKHTKKIDPAEYLDYPKFKDVYSELEEMINIKHYVVHHHDGKTCIKYACEKYNLPVLDARFVDVKMVQQHFKKLENHQLRTIADHYGVDGDYYSGEIPGLVLYQMVKETGKTINELCMLAKPKAEKLSRFGYKIPPASSNEIIVFTNNFCLEKSVLAELATSAGMQVKKNVTRATNILVVGQRDPQYAHIPKSRNEQMAEKWIAKGKNIKIINEDQFLEMIYK